jgi:hypothetical protein
MFNQNKFASSVKTLLSQYKESSFDIAFDLLDIYDGIVRSSMTDLPNGDYPIMTNTATAQNYLGTMSKLYTEDSKDLATTLSQTFVFYWTGASFNIAIPPPGSVQKVNSTVTTILPITQANNPFLPMSTLYLEDTNKLVDIFTTAIATFHKNITVTIQHMIPSPSGPIPGPPIINILG